MFSIAIDGPAASGKSTVAKLLASKYQLIYIDTGAMYRAVTLACLLNKVNVNDPYRLSELLRALNISFEMTDQGQKVHINGYEVTEEIRSVEVTQAVSKVSANPQVRQDMVDKQQAMAQTGKVIMDGRDIGTVVLPDADLKFYLVASARVRARRRYQENLAKGMSDQTLEEIESAIIDRDQYDMNREHSPLTKAEDAIEIDTSNLSIDQVVEKLSTYIDSKLDQQ